MRRRPFADASSLHHSSGAPSPSPACLPSELDEELGRPGPVSQETCVTFAVKCRDESDRAGAWRGRASVYAIRSTTPSICLWVFPNRENSLMFRAVLAAE